MICLAFLLHCYTLVNFYLLSLFCVDSWSSIYEGIPANRAAMATVVRGETEVVIIGGYNAIGASKKNVVVAYNDVWTSADAGGELL